MKPSFGESKWKAWTCPLEHQIDGRFDKVIVLPLPNDQTIDHANRAAPRGRDLSIESAMPSASDVVNSKAPGGTDRSRHIDSSLAHKFASGVDHDAAEGLESTQGLDIASHGQSCAGSGRPDADVAAVGI